MPNLQDAADRKAPNRSLEDAECAICFDDLQVCND